MAKVQIGKEINNRITTGKSISASALHNSEAVGISVEDFLKEKLDLSPGIIKKIMDGLASSLNSSGDVLHDAEQAYVFELADDIPIRTGRDAHETEARTLFSAVRSEIKDTFGEDHLRSYGLYESLPSSAADAAERIANAVRLLKKTPAKKKNILDQEVDTEKLAEKLSEIHEKLSSQLSLLVTEERERQSAIGDRDRAVANWSKTYQGVAHILTGLYILADRNELAEKLRPTSRKTAGSEAVEIVETETGEENPTESSPTKEDPPG